MGIFPKILEIFDRDGIFLGIYCFEKIPRINLGNFRNSFVVFFLFVSFACLIYLGIYDPKNSVFRASWDLNWTIFHGPTMVGPLEEAVHKGI